MKGEDKKKFDLHHKRIKLHGKMIEASELQKIGMTLYTDSYTYEDVFKILNPTEQNILMYMANYHMTVDNFVYLFQELRPKHRVIDDIANSVGITVDNVVKAIKRIEKKQSDFRWFLSDTHSGIKGEYMISPYLIHHSSTKQREILRMIHDVMVNQPKHFNWLKAEYNPKAQWFHVGDPDHKIVSVQNRKKGNHNIYKRRKKAG